MPVFKIKNSKLEQVKQSPFLLESELHKLTESNLEEIFGLEFVSSKFRVGKYEIDTLAFDVDSKCFVLIEYKKGKNFSVIDQGYSYLSSILDNKADCVLEYNEKKNGSLKRKDIDWSQLRVLFLAESFTKYQQDAINFKDLPIELWKTKRYENQTVSYSKVGVSDVKQSIRDVSKDKTMDKVSKEIKVYSIEDVIDPTWENTRLVFDELREKILNVSPQIKEKINQIYIGYKIGSNRLCSIFPFKSKIELVLHRVEATELMDPANRLEIYPEKAGRGKVCKYIIDLSDTKSANFQHNINLDYGMSLVIQVYNKYWP
ncbi:MAG: hypothetical protein OXF42_03220 [Candidatus Dadabacteria bacterium]|nr:hypothetical protein [Candidatus Dadabacteria bacterium]